MDLVVLLDHKRMFQVEHGLFPVGGGTERRGGESDGDMAFGEEHIEPNRRIEYKP